MAAATSYWSSSARQLFSKSHQFYHLRYVTCTYRNIATDSGSVVGNGVHPDEPIDVTPKSVPVHVAYELYKSGHKYLDVRSRDEFLDGSPSKAINIPYMFRGGEGMSKNPKFLDSVSSQFEKNDKILLGCQSGRRSLMAAKDLQSIGFTEILDVAGGYSAWKQNGLPLNEN